MHTGLVIHAALKVSIGQCVILQTLVFEINTPVAIQTQFIHRLSGGPTMSILRMKRNKEINKTK